MDNSKDRTWAEIRLDNIEHNYRAIRSRLPSGCRFLGTVKANAYGHGAVTMAGLLSELGAEYLAVACIDEAVVIRKAGIGLPILVFGYTAPARIDELLEYDLTQTIYSRDLAEAYSAAAHGKKLKCHLKLDSGMGRLGIDCSNAGVQEATSVLRLTGLYFEGVFTHFAVADMGGDSYTGVQFDKFIKTVGELELCKGSGFEIIHCANSGAVVNYPQMYLDMVRPGIALYGGYREHGGAKVCAKSSSGILAYAGEGESSPELKKFNFRPGMELKTRVVQIKEVPQGASISYGRTYVADGIRKIAVLPVGYADGLHRSLSNNMEVLLHGRRIKQVGRICMDMCMVDITNTNFAEVGDEVTIFGKNGEECISVSEHAEKLGTISYELLCSVSARVPRVYIR